MTSNFVKNIFYELKVSAVNCLHDLISVKGKNRARICLHSNTKEKVHVMLIAVEGYHYISPHLSNKKCSLIYILHKGSIKIELPELNKTTELNHDNVIALKVPSDTPRIVSNTNKGVSTYWEITEGPHSTNDTIWI